MSKDLLTTFSEIKSTVGSAKDHSKLTGASRVHALQRELEQLDAITTSIDNVIDSIEATSSNLDVVLSTTGSTNKLLDLWIKILSQASYTTNLLSDKNWKGITKNEEEYQAQLKKFEELNRRYTQEKQRKEQEREALRQKKQTQEQRQQAREDALQRRVYGRGSRPVSSTQKSSSRVSSSVTKNTKR